MSARRTLSALAAAGLAAATLAVAAPAATAAPPGPELLAGETLSAGQSLSATYAEEPEATFELAMQTDGNLVLYVKAAGAELALWSSGTEGHPGARLVQQGDGNAVVYTADGRALWQSGTFDRAGARLVVQGDGNVVVYAGTTPTWQSGTYLVRSLLVPGEGLLPGEDLVSYDRQYRVVMQEDGNLVGYTPEGRAYWHTGTAGHPGAALVLQEDGNLVVYAADGSALWSSGTADQQVEALNLYPGGWLVLFGAEFATVPWLVEGPGPAPVDGDLGSFGF
ncbi:hypothetical protein [Cellulomonas marina]|uniref:D-mannose binding lectin n=1 Tax=Cellulomonas marina TaxID=988821 RepID=A0A1I0Y2A6_9CELL|nr:hypothetical protein [Cellulomonas marina]GIG29758.1 hypothetical protein Cma02nite_23580 [Cellulomonas marina]SFB07499.1 D-mannose binding lectin [Cellulomonas marina]